MRWSGLACSFAALASWAAWIGWRLSTIGDVVGVVVLVVELTAFAAAFVLVVAPWRPRADADLADATTPTGRTPVLPVRVAEPLGVSPVGAVACGVDDTGEVAIARRGFELLDPRTGRPRRGELAWAIVATEGVRRLVFVAVLVVVLLSGRFPFPWPPTAALVALALSQPVLAVGVWLTSGGVVRPGDRLAWSMASIGAGLGDGVSRSRLPIRWAATMATMVVLNLAVSLRGVSDRWTHGLGAMTHDERVLSMVVATWLVIAGLVALRRLPPPVLAPYGATRRLEEGSTRRLALGATFTVAAVGLAAGLLPGAVPA